MPFILLLLLAPHVVVALNSPAAPGVATYDRTDTYGYPYKAAPERAAGIRKSSGMVEKGMALEEAVRLLGEPDIVTDLTRAHWGMSPRDDMFTLRNRGRLGLRAVWYIEKRGIGFNTNDVCFISYTATDQKTIVHTMTQQMVEGDDPRL